MKLRTKQIAAGFALTLGVLGTLWYSFYCVGHLFLGATEFMVDDGSAHQAQVLFSGAALYALRGLPCLAIAYLSGRALRT
jgi:hypothetical protein